MTRLGRNLFFFATFALFWVTTSPFIDLRSADVLRAQESGSAVNQIAVLLLLVFSMIVLWVHRQAALSVISPAMACVLLWQLVTVVASTHPDLSARRYILSLCVIFITLAWLLVAKDTDHFRRLLRIAAAFVLALAYYGVIFRPEVSIHNLSDVLELINAGSWRGHFAHKNIAGPAMVVLMLYWLYLAGSAEKTWSRLLCWLFALLSLNFLYHTNNKTSLGLVAIMFVLAFLIQRARFLWLQMLIAFVPASLMALLTLGSVAFEPVGRMAEALLSDPSFTNRDDIWRFGLDRLWERPLMGYGFEAFWATSTLRSGEQETWAAAAGHAHNGFLNLALTTGLIGMFLAIWWLVINPLRDFNKSQKTANDPDLALLYLRIWLFMLLYANLESPFFVGRGNVWFSLLGAVFGLRLHARLKQMTEHPVRERATAGLGRPALPLQPT